MFYVKACTKYGFVTLFRLKICIFANSFISYPEETDKTENAVNMSCISEPENAYFYESVCVYCVLRHREFYIVSARFYFPQVFTSIALLNMLIGPLNAFPWVLNGLTEAWVSLKRIQRLLEVRIGCA
jgi:ABC-type multidrug transport system fused ATPase/permease subunit